MAEKDKKKFKREVVEIKSGNSKHKSEMQLYIKKMLKIFMIRDKKVLNYLMINQKLNLNLFIDQNTMKLWEQNLKY